MTAFDTLLPTRRATLRLAADLAARLEPSDLVVLVGALGAGKTFFVRGLVRRLGLPPGERVTSPTFALVQDFNLSRRVVHADLYRLNDPDEVRALGLREERNAGSVVIVEWGLPFLLELGGDALLIDFERVPDSEHGRRARLAASGSRSSELCAALAASRT